jgi:integrase
MAVGILPRIGTEKVKVVVLLDMLLADYEINGKSLKWAGYVDGHLRPFFGGMRVVSVGTDAFARYIAERRKNGALNSTINRELALLRRAYQLGFDAEPRQVSAIPKIPKFAENNVRKGFFDHEDFVRLRAELPEHLKPVVTFAYFTGCRKGEILSLRWNQIDLRARVVRLEPGETKNKEPRTIQLIAELSEMLALLLERRDQFGSKCEFVFTRFGKPIRRFHGAWLEASKRAGLIVESGKAKMLFHDLRRTGVRNLIRAGVPERVAMMISGHKTRSILDRYNVVDERDLHLAGERLEEYLRSQSGDGKDKSSTSAEEKDSKASSIDGHQTPRKFLN